MDSKDDSEQSIENSDFSGTINKRHNRQSNNANNNLNTKTTTIHQDRLQGKENQNLNLNQDHHERFCFECNRSLAKSRHLINIAGQMHKWHPECFKCNVCNHPMDRESSCHIYKDKIICREDYARLQRNNSIKCSRCRWPIAASDWVRKAGQYVYHLACFSCDICLRQLSTGEQFTINIQEKSIVKLLCRLHFAIENQPQRTGGTTATTTTATTIATAVITPAMAADNNQITRSSTSPSSTRSFDFTYGSHAHHFSAKFQQNFNQDQYLHLLASTSSTQGTSQQTPLLLGDRKADLEESAGSLVHQLSDETQHQHPISQRAGTSTSSSNGSTNGIHLGIPSKSKRVRTTFTEDQLSILQTHFQIDSNPDGQDLERIATITGLSKRVTQVWFQNSRARQKKYMIKRKPSSSSSATTSSGFPGSSNIQAKFSQHSQQIQHQLHGELNAAECYHQGTELKWSANMSELSDSSLDRAEALEDIEDTRFSSDDQLIVSDDSSE